MALVLVGALTTLAGCGSSAPQVAPVMPYTASNPTIASPTPAPWLPMTDRRSGVSFELPHRIKPVQTKGTPPTWVYQVPMGTEENVDGDKLTVGIAFFDGGIPGLATVLDNLAAAAKRAGMKDAGRSQLHANRVSGVSAQTGALTFTAATDQKAYWLVTEFAAGRYAVAAQVYSLSGADALPARQQQVRQLMRQLVASIKVP